MLPPSRHVAEPAARFRHSCSSFDQFPPRIPQYMPAAIERGNSKIPAGILSSHTGGSTFPFPRQMPAQSMRLPLTRRGKRADTAQGKTGKGNSGAGGLAFPTGIVFRRDRLFFISCPPGCCLPSVSAASAFWERAEPVARFFDSFHCHKYQSGLPLLTAWIHGFLSAYSLPVLFS